MDPRMLLEATQQGGNQFWSGFPGVMQGLSGNSGRPYEKALDAYQPYMRDAKKAQNPFFTAGTNAIGDVQNWLQSQKDPSAFINQIMSKYQESPFAKYSQQQGIRTAQNLGSATGLTGSTPLMKQAEQNAQNISSQDMNSWLQDVLGINTQYGKGEFDLMNQGQHSADILSQLNNDFGQYAGGSAYGKAAGEQSDRNALWSGIAKMFGG